MYKELQERKSWPVAQLDAGSNGDQEVKDSTPAGSATFFCGDLEIFSTVILSLMLNQKGQLSVSGERMCAMLVNHIEDKACPGNV